MSERPPPSTAAQLELEQQRTEQAHERTQQLREREKTGRWKAVVETIPILATLITVSVALLSSWQTQTQYRDSQASERFQNAVEMLAGADLTTRVGGIALLGQVIEESPTRRENAVRLLATYLRVHSPVTEKGRKLPITVAPPAEEVRAVMVALEERGDVRGIDLGRVSLRNLMSSNADLTGLIFSRSDLSGSILQGANLTGVTFQGTTLKSVNFRKANLTRADFQGADLTGAQLQESNLSGADLSGATGLTSEQLAGASSDEKTRLPSGVSIPAPSDASPPAPTTPSR